MSDLLIKNGFVVDGSGSSPVKGHVYLKAGRIEAVEQIACNQLICFLGVRENPHVKTTFFLRVKNPDQRSGFFCAFHGKPETISCHLIPNTKQK